MTTEWITQSGPGRVGILQKRLNPSNLVLKAGLCIGGETGGAGGGLSPPIFEGEGAEPPHF